MEGNENCSFCGKGFNQCGPMAETIDRQTNNSVRICRECAEQSIEAIKTAEQYNRQLATRERIPNKGTNEIPQAANRVLRDMPNRLFAVDRIVGEELLVDG
jgi:hypothetical protein